MWKATLHGHCWTILNGQMDTLSDLEWFMLIIRMDLTDILKNQLSGSKSFSMNIGIDLHCTTLRCLVIYLLNINKCEKKWIKLILKFGVEISSSLHLLMMSPSSGLSWTFWANASTTTMLSSSISMSQYFFKNIKNKHYFLKCIRWLIQILALFTLSLYSLDIYIEVKFIRKIIKRYFWEES